MFSSRSFTRLLGDASLGIVGLLLGAGLFLLGSAVLSGGEATAAEQGVTIQASPVAASPAGSPAGAVAALLDAEAADDSHAAFVLLSEADRLSYPTPALWADREPLGPVEGWRWIDEDALVTRVELTPGLSTTSGWSPAEAVITWAVVDEDGWRLSLVDSVVEPITVDDAGLTDAVDRWLTNPDRCAEPGVPAHAASSLFDAVCAAGGVRAGSAPSPVTGRTASNLSLAYGDGVATWARTVELEGGRHLLVVSIGSEWVVIDAMTP